MNVTLPWSQNFWITIVASLSNEDGDCNENGRMPLPPRPEARLKKDTRLLSKACVAAGLVARVTDRELDIGYIGDLE